MCHPSTLLLRYVYLALVIAANRGLSIHNSSCSDQQQHEDGKLNPF